MTSADAAEAFYCRQLGFEIEFEVRTAPDRRDPCYLGLARDSASLHLSPHAGDGVVGGVVYILVNDVDALHAEFLNRGVSMEIEPVDQTVLHDSPQPHPSKPPRKAEDRVIGKSGVTMGAVLIIRHAALAISFHGNRDVAGEGVAPAGVQETGIHRDRVAGTPEALASAKASRTGTPSILPPMLKAKPRILGTPCPIPPRNRY